MSGVFHSSDAGYDAFMGRYSRQLAPLFADFAGAREGMRVLDVGAGTGALTEELQRRGTRFAAVEPSPEFCAALRARFDDVHEASAERLPFEDGTFDAALAQLVVTFMADAPAGLAEMRRVVRPGGVVAVTMWDRDGMEMLAAIGRTQQALTPSAPTSEARTRYRSRDELAQLVGDGAELELLTVEASYADFDELWSTLLDGAGPAGAWATSLAGEQREEAREELRRQVGGPGGGFTLRGRAWAARATRA